MARYIERAENLARLLDVNAAFSRDSQGVQNWRSILEIHGDEQRFFALHPEASTRAVLRFYVLDDDNPASVMSCIRLARENARSLRPLISTEMWGQINVFYNRVRGLRDHEIESAQFSRVASFIKEGCQTHTGITEGTMHRDAGWYFYQLGRNLERADQMTRLLEVKCHLLLPDAADPGSAADISQWIAILRSAAGYHAFRRAHPSSTAPSTVARFLLFNRSFPRSVAACTTNLTLLTTEMRSRYRLPGGVPVLERLDRLTSRLETAQDRFEALERIDKLEDFLNRLQLELNAVSDALGAGFFGYGAVDAPADPTQ